MLSGSPVAGGWHPDRYVRQSFDETPIGTSGDWARSGMLPGLRPRCARGWAVCTTSAAVRAWIELMLPVTAACPKP